MLLIFGVVVIALMIFTMVDVILTDRRRIRALNKTAWFFVVIIPVVGPALWFFLGKDRPDSEGQRRTLAPDDDPNFLKNIRRDEEQDERIRRLEQELAELDDDPPKE
ncbi:PLD nuclease N-terminal domain-containing protein [Conyzicola lurida]|uniref:PLD nuclease N-terminal domain-containing protein n=1 Tax=Conyzicola lurida TaxID=1172621 RepID=UPI001FEB7F4C|nr:PLD nuclease N-terminal domain-containing protein [Conyzicola lurida]